MGKIAYIFSGQGAQYSGMGRSLYETSVPARTVFDTLERLRPGTIHQCFDTDVSELTLTKNTQPCMFVLEMAAAAALDAEGVQPQAVAGFSLGEISALTRSGAVSLETGFSLVCTRGELMQQAAEQSQTGMVAVLKLKDSDVEQLCSQFQQVYSVNYNCPGQIAVAGELEELGQFSAAVKQAGGRAVPLKVRGAFHSPFMRGAAEKFFCTLNNITFSAPKLPLYSNVTGQLYEGQLPDLLSRQICSPVRWQQIITHMQNSGIDTVIELGPGKVLCGLVRKTAPKLRTFHVEDTESLSETLKEVVVC